MLSSTNLHPFLQKYGLLLLNNFLSEQSVVARSQIKLLFVVVASVGHFHCDYFVLANNTIVETDIGKMWHLVIGGCKLQ